MRQARRRRFGIFPSAGELSHTGVRLNSSAHGVHQRDHLGPLSDVLGHTCGSGLGKVGLEVPQCTARAWNFHVALRARLRSVRVAVF